MSNQEKLSFSEVIEIAIETGLQLIPCVGGSISTAYFSTKQAKEYKRIERLYSELSDELSAMKSKIASIKNQDEDGLISLIEQVNDKVEKEHQELKFQCYKKYMKNILINPVNINNYDKRKIFLDNISDMSIIECEILILFYKNLGKWAKVKTVNYKGVNQYAIVGAISKLKSYGFLRSSQDTILVGGGDNLLEENITITDYGQEFVEFTLE